MSLQDSHLWNGRLQLLDGDLGDGLRRCVSAMFDNAISACQSFPNSECRINIDVKVLAEDSRCALYSVKVRNLDRS